MLQETCCSVFGKRLTTDMTCAVSHAVYVLHPNEICPKINLIVFKITSFKIMSKFGGQPVYKKIQGFTHNENKCFKK